MNNLTEESGLADCLICFSKIENYDLLPDEESQKIVDSCWNYLPENIANNKLQNVQSENGNEFPLCKKYFDAASELIQLSELVMKSQKKILNLSFAFSLGVLARRTQVQSVNNLPDGQNPPKEFNVLDVAGISPSLFSTDQTNSTEIDDFAHPCEDNFVGIDAALNGPQHIFEIVKHESEDDTNTARDEEFPAHTRPVVVLKRLKEAKVSEKFNSKSSPQQATSNPSSLKRQLRNVTSKKIGQSSSSNIIHPKAGRGNLMKVKKSVKVRGRVGRVGKKEHKCHLCDKVFTDASSLKNHIRVHTGEKPFKCSFCEKSFNQMATLQTHVRIHTGEKPFKCSFCAIAVTDSSNLQRHVRIHTGEKPFKCFQCPKTFAHSMSLKCHLRIHHAGEKTSYKQ